jgi:hypothetical protein
MKWTDPMTRVVDTAAGSSGRVQKQLEAARSTGDTKGQNWEQTNQYEHWNSWE